MFVAVRAWTGGAALGAMHSGRVTSPPVEAPKTSLGFQLLRSPASTESPAASQFFFSRPVCVFYRLIPAAEALVGQTSRASQTSCRSATFCRT